MSFLSSPRPSRLLTIASTLLFAATTSGQSDLCGISTAWANTDGQYIFNNNAWGASTGSGTSCTNVNDDGGNFETIWEWTEDATDTHGFPNVQLNTFLFPLLMSDLDTMNLQATWSMSPVDGLTRANVVYDMFVDPDSSIANDTVKAKYEIMIWIGAYGDPWPLGADTNPWGVVNTSLPSLEVGGTTFSLFSGANTEGQTVHSWTAPSNVTEFTGDVTPLINYLTKNNLVESDAYMGVLQFGSETFHSSANVTFDVKSFNLNVTSTNATANAIASAAVNPSATPTSGLSTSSTSSSDPSSTDSSSRTSTPSSTASSSSAASTTGSSGTSSSGGSSSGSSGTSSTSSSASASSSSSSSSIISLPFWFWEIAAAGCLFAML